VQRERRCGEPERVGRLAGELLPLRLPVVIADIQLHVRLRQVPVRADELLVGVREPALTLGGRIAADQRVVESGQWNRRDR